jgi:hypothetical protein
MELENHSVMRVFERDANHSENIFPNFSGLLMKYRDEVLRFLDRVAMYFKEEL